MPFQYQIKEWDTNFFGYPVVNITGEGTEADFMEFYNQLKVESIVLAYWFFETNCAYKKKLAESYKAISTNIRLTHIFDLANFKEPLNSSPNISSETMISSELFELTIECGNFSRFKMDSTFGDLTYKRMYELWLQKSLTYDKVFIYKEDIKIEGFAVVEIKEKDALFHFLATDKNSRGKGIGKKLTEEVKTFAIRKGCARVIAFTHLINPPIWQLLESCGFKKSQEEYIYHLWI